MQQFIRCVCSVRKRRALLCISLLLMLTLMLLLGSFSLSHLSVFDSPLLFSESTSRTLWLSGSREARSKAVVLGGQFWRLHPRAVLSEFTRLLHEQQQQQTLTSTGAALLTGPSQADLRRFTLSSVPHHTLVFANTFVSLTNTLPRLPLINHCVANGNYSATERGITPSLADIPDLAAHRRKFFDVVQNGNYSDASKATHTEQGFQDFRKYTSWMFPESPPFEPSLHFNESHPRETCKPHSEHVSGYDDQRVYRIRNFCIKPMGGLLTGPLTGDLQIRSLYWGDGKSDDGTGSGSYDDTMVTDTPPFFKEVQRWLMSAQSTLSGNECYLQTKLIIYPIFQRCDNMCHVTMRIGSLKRMIQQLFPPKTHITIAFLVLPDGDDLCTNAQKNRNISNSFAFYANMVGHDHFATWGMNIANKDLKVFFPDGFDKDGAMQRPMCFSEAVLWHNAHKRSKDEPPQARDEPGYQFAFNLFGLRVERDKETMMMVTDMITGCFGLKRRAHINRVRPVFVFALRTGSRFFTHNGLIVAALHEYLSRNNAALDVIEHTKLAPTELITRHVTADAMLGMLTGGMIWSLLLPPNSMVAEVSIRAKNMLTGVKDGINRNVEMSEYGGNAYSSGINHVSYTAPDSQVRTRFGWWNDHYQPPNGQNIDLPPGVFLELARIGLCFARGPHPTAVGQENEAAKESHVGKTMATGKKRQASCFMDHAYINDVVAEHVADRDGRFLLELARWFTSDPGVFQEGKALLNPGAAKLLAQTFAPFRRIGAPVSVLEVPAVVRLCPRVDTSKSQTRDTVEREISDDQTPEVVSRVHVGYWSILAHYFQWLKPVRVMKLVSKGRASDVSACSTADQKNQHELLLGANIVQQKRERTAQRLLVPLHDTLRYMGMNGCEVDVERILSGTVNLTDPLSACCLRFRLIFLQSATLDYRSAAQAADTEMQRASILRFFAALLDKDSWLVITNVQPQNCEGSLPKLVALASKTLKLIACDDGLAIVEQNAQMGCTKRELSPEEMKQKQQERWRKFFG